MFLSGLWHPYSLLPPDFLSTLQFFKTDLGLLILITALAVVGKIVGTALFYLPSKNGWREGITIGTGMNGRGAVEIIIAEIGLGMGIIDKTIFSILVFMAIFTTLTVPVLLSWTTKWLRKTRRAGLHGQPERSADSWCKSFEFDSCKIF